MNEMSDIIRQAAEEHENKGGGRSAFSFVCGAEYILDQIKDLLDHSVGQHLVYEYVDKMKNAIDKL